MNRVDRSRVRRIVAALAGAMLLTPLLAALPSEAAPGDPSVTAATDAQAGWIPPTVVMLITGDVVRVRTLADGRVSVTIEPGGEDRTFTRYTDPAGDLHVVPARLVSLIPERLDPRLFNVSALARDGYGAADRQDLPLIVTYDGPAATGSIPGSTVRRSLPSIDGAAVSLDREGAIALGAALLPIGGAASALPGVEKIWLDGPMTAALDESVPQIGAPAAWDQGYDGSDVTIAVVDTGIDESHPDVDGRVIAAEEFADTGSTTDVFGHGTHVASIAAGSGAASDGQFTGVAYAADLVNAKVLDDSGSGFESWVIAGMEWSAIDQDADVINMSLTGGVTDGTDPVSQAVNNLSADEGALFVTAAGNFGGAAETVETPSTADAALAVGAVDKSDVYADWSGQGPRLDDFAVKPEIVAPGVDITAARAEGADIGPPVGEDYMELTGTSMAAPHVAGAAALLLQANPGWGWSELKNALVTSAVDVGATAFQQGGGRVDVEAALDQTVHSDVATVNLGSLEFPHDDGETSTAEVIFSNDGDTEISLDLAVTAAGEDGQAVPAEMITLDTASLVLAPGASDTATVTFDPETGPYGLISGSLVAAADGVEALHLPVGAQKETEVFDVTLEVLDTEGGDQIFGAIAAFSLDTDAYFEFLDVSPGATTIEIRVPEGTYGFLFQGFEEMTESEAIITVVEPELVVDGDLTVVFDGQTANEATYDVGEPVTEIAVSASVERSGDFFGLIMGTFAGPGTRVFAAPSEPVSIGTFAYSTEWVATAGDINYILTLPEPDVIPVDLTYELGSDQLAEISSALSSDIDHEYVFFRVGFTESGSGGGLGWPIAVPAVRTDRVTTEGLIWSGLLDAGETFLSGEFEKLPIAYAPGTHTDERWLSRPVRPAIHPEQPAPVRFGDEMYFGVLTFVDPDWSWGFADPGFEAPSIDTVSYSLTADGEVIAEGGELFDVVSVPSDPATYELTLDTARDAKWWQTSTQTHSVWQFDSEQSDEPEVELPMLQIDYELALDEYNHADAPTPIRLRPYNLAERTMGADAIASLAAWSSIDDGETWTEIEVQAGSDGTYEGTIAIPASCDPSCAVSLRVETEDTEGNALEQEITRAYSATYVAPPPTTPVPTTTLPPTGAGDTGSLAGLGLVVLVAGGLAVALARRRLRTASSP